MNTPAMGQPPRPQPLLSLRGLRVSFSGIAAAEDVSLTVYPRQTVAVVGESGSGKSVTALSMMGLLPATASIDAGSAMFTDGARAQGLDLLHQTPAAMRLLRGGRIGMIFQEPMTSLNPVMSIGEQVMEAARAGGGVSGREARAAAVRALEEVGISGSAGRMGEYPHQFSGGMRQRVMIAMALVRGPALLFADEPTTALDVTVQAQVLDLIGSLKRSRGLGVLLITHDMGVVAGYADVVCVMYRGRVVEYAPVADLFRAPLHPYTIGLLEALPARAVKGRPLTTVAQLAGDEARFGPVRASDGRSLRPWWPGHADRFAHTASPALVQTEKNRWVCCWAERGDGASAAPPDVAPEPGKEGMQRCA